MDFEILCENIEHENRIAALVFHLLGDLSVDGGDEGVGRENGVEKLGESVLEIGKGKLLKNPGKGRVAGNAIRSFSGSKPKKLLELHHMNLGPTFDFGEHETVGEETKKEEGENGTKGVGLALFGARIMD